MNYKLKDLKNRISFFINLIIKKYNKRQKKYPKNELGIEDWLTEKNEFYLNELVRHFTEELGEFLFIFNQLNRIKNNKEYLTPSEINDKLKEVYDEAVDIGLMAFILADRINLEIK